MQRVFSTSVKDKKNEYVFSNNFLEEVIETIQILGGGIITFQVMPLSDPNWGQYLLVVYEDKGNYDSLKAALDKLREHKQK